MSVASSKKYIKYLKYILTFILFFFFSKAQVFNCTPFAIAALFALMWTGFNLPIIIAEYCCVCLALDCSLTNIYTTICIVATLLLVYLLHKKLKLPMNVGLVNIYLLLSQACGLYYSFANNIPLLEIIINLILLIVSLNIFILVFQVVVLRGVFYKFTVNESIAFSYMLIVVGLGLSSFQYYGLDFVKLVAVFLMLFLIFIGKDYFALIAGISLTIGNTIYNFETILIANVVIIFLGCKIFSNSQKIRTIICAVLADLAYNLYLFNFNWGLIDKLMPTVLAIMLVIFIPKKLINFLQDKLYISESEMSMRNIVNRTRVNFHRRFDELSNVFNEMKAIHLNMIRDDLSIEQLTPLLFRELKNSFCKDCLGLKQCYLVSVTEKDSALYKLIDIALNKGKISILDIPTSLTSRCSMINLLIGKINQLVEQYKDYNLARKEVNSVKGLLAEQLGAVSQIMLDLGNEIDKNISFDSHLESQLMNDLLAENIICSEIVLYTEADLEKNVTLIIKGENAYNPKIMQIINKKLKTKMRVAKIQPIEANGFYSVNLVKDNNYDLTFGLASCVKTGSQVSGDSHCLIRLGGNKFLVALCDGMGSGENANRTSALTINLIEDFYKAGFSNDIVLSSVNKLLTINSQDTYSTLDLCLIDLNKELVDFIKIGAPLSVIRNERDMEIIEGGALPMGVLENIIPYIHKTSLNTKSLLIMATDGIIDAFGNRSCYEDFIKSIVSTNPQSIAEAILNEAVSKFGYAKDDMTVLVIRSFRKNS